MHDGWLDDSDLDTLVRQAVDMLYPPAQITVQALNGDRATTQQWGGIARTHTPVQRRAIIRIAEDDCATIGINPGWSPAEALANIIDELSVACGGQFRGRPFPNCPGHTHASVITVDKTSIALSCPIEDRSVARIEPAVRAER